MSKRWGALLLALLMALCGTATAQEQKSTRDIALITMYTDDMDGGVRYAFAVEADGALWGFDLSSQDEALWSDPAKLTDFLTKVDLPGGEALGLSYQSSVVDPDQLTQALQLRQDAKPSEVSTATVMLDAGHTYRYAVRNVGGTRDILYLGVEGNDEGLTTDDNGAALFALMGILFPAPTSLYWESCFASLKAE